MTYRYLFLLALMAPLFAHSQVSLPTFPEEGLKAAPGTRDAPLLPIGDSENMNVGLTLFPNSSNGVFYLDIKKLDASTVVYDEGKLLQIGYEKLPFSLAITKYNDSKLSVYTFEGFYPMTKRIDLTSLGQGKYLATVSNPERVVRRQLIIGC